MPSSKYFALQAYSDEVRVSRLIRNRNAYDDILQLLHHHRIALGPVANLKILLRDVRPGHEDEIDTVGFIRLRHRARHALHVKLLDGAPYRGQRLLFVMFGSPCYTDILPITDEDVNYEKKALLLSLPFDITAWPFSLELLGDLFIDDEVACPGCFEIGRVCDLSDHRPHCSLDALPAIRNYLNRFHPALVICGMATAQKPHMIEYSALEPVLPTSTSFSVGGLYDFPSEPLPINLSLHHPGMCMSI